MNYNKKVSIIIPTYNEEKYLPYCLESISILNYPGKDIEVIVVDNGSTDSTRATAERYGVRVLLDDSLNVSGLRNLGVTQSTGEIITFVDADCIVSKEWLNKASLYFCDLCVAAWGSPPAPPMDSTWVQKTWYLIRQKENQVQDVDWLESMNLFVRRKQFIAVGGFNKSLVTCEDVDFSYRLRKYGRIVSDSRIEVIHLGEAATVKEFMKKEIWRGRSNLKGVFNHGLVMKEIPSLIIPLYFGILLPTFLFVSLIFLGLKWLILLVFLYMLPSFGVILKIRAKKVRLGDMLRIMFLIQIYFLSRTIAIVKRN
ncbi:MAG: glycosyltransferase [Candidatus Scalindua sp.]|nr:glycosyltransferase [Candidatus Scalindua sp.]